MIRIFLPLALRVYGKTRMEYEDLKPRNRSRMALTACLCGFFGIHNFLLSNNVSGSIKIYLTLVALIVDFAWILLDLWQICYAQSLPEIRLEGSRKKAALIVLAYLMIVATGVTMALRYSELVV